MKYQNIKNGLIGTVVSEDTKCKTVMLRMEDGQERPYSTSTIKRWWKEIPDEELAGDGTSHKEVMQEILQDEKKHIQEVMQQKKDLGIEVPPIKEVTVVEEGGKKVNKKLKVDGRKVIMDTILDTLSKDGVEYVTYAKIPNMVVVRCGKKSVFELRVKKTGVTFNCREKDAPDNVDFHKVNNYYMPIVINSTEDTWMGIFESFLGSIDDYRKEV